jgi:hypothetical protein
MFWIGAAVAVGAAIVGLLVASFSSKRPAGVDALGSVSPAWIAEHRVDLP